MRLKVKRTLSSLYYRARRFYKWASTIKPSQMAISVIAIVIAVFLLGGGLYAIIVKPYPAVYYGGRFVFLNPFLSDQFISECIIAIALYSLGALGLITMYQSTKYAYKPRQAYMMFLLGVTLLVIAYIFLEVAIQIKLGR